MLYDCWPGAALTDPQDMPGRGEAAAVVVLPPDRGAGSVTLGEHFVVAVLTPLPNKLPLLLHPSPRL